MSETRARPPRRARRLVAALAAVTIAAAVTVGFTTGASASSVSPSAPATSLAAKAPAVVVKPAVAVDCPGDSPVTKNVGPDSFSFTVEASCADGVTISYGEAGQASDATISVAAGETSQTITGQHCNYEAFLSDAKHGSTFFTPLTFQVSGQCTTTTAPTTPTTSTTPTTATTLTTATTPTTSTVKTTPTTKSSWPTTTTKPTWTTTSTKPTWPTTPTTPTTSISTWTSTSTSTPPVLPTCVDASYKVLSHTWDNHTAVITLSGTLPLCTPLYTLGATYTYDANSTGSVPFPQTLAGTITGPVISKPGVYTATTPNICGQTDLYAKLGSAPVAPKTLTGPGSNNEPNFVSDFSAGPATYYAADKASCVPVITTTPTSPTAPTSPTTVTVPTTVTSTVTTPVTSTVTTPVTSTVTTPVTSTVTSPVTSTVTSSTTSTSKTTVTSTKPAPPVVEKPTAIYVAVADCKAKDIIVTVFNTSKTYTAMASLTEKFGTVSVTGSTETIAPGKFSVLKLSELGFGKLMISGTVEFSNGKGLDLLAHLTPTAVDSTECAPSTPTTSGSTTPPAPVTVTVTSTPSQAVVVNTSLPTSGDAGSGGGNFKVVFGLFLAAFALGGGAIALQMRRRRDPRPNMVRGH